MSTTVSERCPHCGEGSGEPGQHCGGASRMCKWWKCDKCGTTVSRESYFLSAENRALLPESDSGTYQRGETDD